MKTMKLFFGAAFVGAALMMTSPAFAGGLVLSKAELSTKHRSSLVQRIAKAKAQHPDAFKLVAQAPDLAVKRDQEKRGRAATITQALRSLGPDGLYPMLEMLAVDGPARGNMSDSAWTTLRVGLLEAVGALRSKEARPVLEGVLKKGGDFEVMRAATEALGQLGDDAATKFLVRLAKKPGPERVAVLSGLGECRRIGAAKELARSVHAATPVEARAIVASLQDVGNSWAWETPAVKQSGEGDQVRAIAAQALMEMFVKFRGELRTKAETGLLVVKHSSTPQLIQAARQGADARTVAALDALAQRFANNPLH